MTTLLENRAAAGAQEPQASKPSLAGMTKPELMAALAAAGVSEAQSKMRAGQLWNWMYARGARDFAELTNIAKGLRAELDARFTLARPEIAAEQISEDGTRKWLLRLEPQAPGERAPEVETVYIPEPDRGTLCISSQVGCTLNCSFCHTGTQRLVRNLTPAEIARANPHRPRLYRRLARRRRPRQQPRHPGRGAQDHQHRADGDGRAALQFRACAGAPSRSSPTDGLGILEAPRSRFRPRASCR